MNVLLPVDIDQRISRVCSWTMGHPADDLSLERLAGVANLSPYYFLRLFKAVMKETPHHFVARVRIDRAKDLLAGKTYTVTDICFMVGFQSMGSFSRIFHKATGWTPSIYRSRAWEMSSHPARFIPGCYIHQFGFSPYLGCATVSASK